MGNDGNETPFVPTVPIVSIVSFVPIVSTVPTVPTVRNVPIVLFVPAVRNVPIVLFVPAVRNVPIVLFVPAVRNVPIVLFVPAVRIVPIVPNVPFVPYRKNVPVVSGVPGPLRHGAEAPRHLPRTRGRQPSPSQSACASCATSPARGRGSPLRHSPLARPVPPLPHAGEANVTYRSCLPRLRDCEAEARPADETAEAEQGAAVCFLQARSDGRSKNRAPQPWPAGPERATFTGLRSKNRAPQPWPAGPERAHVYGTAQQKQGTANRGPQGRRGGHPSAAPERE